MPRTPAEWAVRVLNGDAKGTCVTWSVAKGPLTLGRDPASGLVLFADHVSAHHAEIVWDGAALMLRDLGSTNGTRRVRDGAVQDASGAGLALADGDRLSMGDRDGPLLVEVVLDAERLQADPEPLVIATTSIGRLAEIEGWVSRNPPVLQKLYTGLKRLNNQLDFSVVLEAGVRLIFDVMGPATHVSVLIERDTLVPDGSAALVPAICLRRDGSAEVARPMSRGLRASVLDTQSAVLATAAEIEGSKSLQGAHIDAVIAVPMSVGERLVGIVQIDRREGAGLDQRAEPRPFYREDLELAVVVVSHLALALEHARLYQRVLASEERLRGENRFLKGRDAQPSARMVGVSPAMRRVSDLIDRVKDTSVPVCIVGETGTGKELVARAIHYRSVRCDKLFVAQNCAALPEDLLESELFGHMKGAFTGADSDKKGLFEVAHGGTIFLDEIAETSPAVQAKLLRVLQEGEVRPVGSGRTRKVDVHVVSATNRNLEEEVAEGRFREDLFYRLHVFPLALPPLRDRTIDIPLLVEHFMAQYALEFERPVMRVTSEAMQLMVHYKWPGNIRELQNELQRVIICATHGELVQPDDLSRRIRSVEQTITKAGDDTGLALRERLGNVERYMLIEALRDNDNNKTRTAVALGITREGLHKKLARYGL